MMTLAYSNAYLEDAMTSVGAMLDYAVNTCGEDLPLFYARFLGSGLAREISRCNPRYLAGMSGIELALLVAERTGDPLPVKEAFIDTGCPEYWTGWTLAYLSWYLCLDFSTLQFRGVEVLDLYHRYSTLHEADLSKSVQFAMRRLEKSQTDSNLLKRARRNAGLTQQELARRSGTSLRVIRSYEQGQRSLRNAAAESVRHLSLALGCRMEDLLPAG